MVAAVGRRGHGLCGLVNNAGIATGGPLPRMSMEEFDFAMAVNVEGSFLVTRAFAPLILDGKGRIVNIGSISGIQNEPQEA